MYSEATNWRDEFYVVANATPLEDNNSLIQFLIDHLTDQLRVKMIIVYLLLMLSVILISKLIISKNYNVTSLDRYPLGSYLRRFLVYIISI